MSSSAVATQEVDLRKLHSDVMRGKWSEVFETYKKQRALRTTKITGTGDTVLHMAVSNGEVKLVADIVDLIVLERDDEESWNMNIVLGAENDKNNTPLHLAAIKGNIKMCKKIGGTSHSLIAKRNIAGETPLFLAVFFGNKEAFLHLHYMYMSHVGVSSTDNLAHCIRNDQNTILHCAIAKGHIDIAIEIIHLYKNLVRRMRPNEEGSPLHLLATNLSSFKSTAILPGAPIVAHPIYWLLTVKEKNQATMLKELQKKNLIGTVISLLGFLLLCLLFRISEKGSRLWSRILKMKKEHTWSLQIMNELLRHVSDEDMSPPKRETVSEQHSIFSKREEIKGSKSMVTPPSGAITIETPLMIAAKNGVVEMVEKILELFPSTIKDVNIEGKNILQLAVKYRKIKLYQFLCKQQWLTESMFRHVDEDGNNALHMAAGPRLDLTNHGEGLSMLSEIYWFKYVKSTTPRGLLEGHNNKMETPEDIFRESHKELMEREGKWVTKTSQACSLVSTLVLSVVFASRTSVPGGYEAKSGLAILRNNRVFHIFEFCSFVAFSLSFISTLCFLSIAALPSQSVRSWEYIVPQLYNGIVSLIVSIVFLWFSFCTSNFFLLDDKSQNQIIIVYVLVSMAIILLVGLFFGRTLRITFQRKNPAPRLTVIHPIRNR